MKSFTKASEDQEHICPQYRTKYCYNECNWFGNCPDLERGDALPEGMAICSNCGAIDQRKYMISLCPGRNPQLFCPDCYRRAMHETAERNYDKKVKKLHENGRQSK